MSDLRTDRNTRPVPGEEAASAASPKKMIAAVIALGAVAAFGISIWFAYDQGVKRGTSGAPPLIRAEQGPTKVAPENPGGMQIPNQDKQIYERLDGGNVQAQGGQKVERLLPPPEQPTATPTQPVQKTDTAAAPAAATPQAKNGAAITVPTRPAPSPVPNQAPAIASAEKPAAGKPAEKPAEKPADRPVESQTAAAPAAPKPAAPAPAAVAAPGGSAKIQLASLKTQAAAQSTWAQLQKKYADILGDLTPSYERVDIPNKGTFVRLQAGPLKDRAAAQALCQQLAAKNQGCIVVGR